MAPPHLPVIFGCEGETLKSEERAFFHDAKPWGFILFERNLKDEEQIRRLRDALWESVGREALILIDQEGGKVQRLKPPLAPLYPPLVRLGKMAQNAPSSARRAAYLCGRLMADDLVPLGIRVNCAPVLDLPVAGADPIIGSRALGVSPQETALMASAFAKGLLEGGCLPVLKHIPGHGRARADSHQTTPFVQTDKETLAKTDFHPFHALRELPLAMTAHIVFSDIDAARPATLSPVIIERVIRRQIGFEGLLLSDAIEMGALEGDVAQSALKAHEAGCDLILSCLPDMGDMKRIAERMPSFSQTPRFEKALSYLKPPQGFDREKAWREWENLLGEGVSEAKS